MTLSTARAQTAGPLADCAYGAPDEKIAACTKHIEAGKLDAHLIALAHSNRGEGYLEKNEADKAFADFNRSIELDPSWTRAYFHRAQIHSAAGRKDEAIADYRKILHYNPTDRTVREALAKLGVKDSSPPPAVGGGSGGGGIFPEMR